MVQIQFTRSIRALINNGHESFIIVNTTGSCDKRKGAKMSKFLDRISERAKAIKKLLFYESTDIRTIEATAIILEKGLRMLF